MNLSAIQLVQPRAADTSVSAIAARFGRVALLYLALAATGTTLTLVAFLLTWQNLSIVFFGFAVGLGVIHTTTIFMDILLLARQLRAELRSFAEVWTLLRAELRIWDREVDRRFDGDDTQEIRPRRARRHYALAYGSVFTMLVPCFVVLGQVSTVFRWSSMSGIVIGIAALLITRVIFHIHMFGVGHGRAGGDVHHRPHR